MNKAQLMQKRHQLTLDNLYLGRHIAKKYAGKLDLDTLFSIADEKLFVCTGTHDETQGNLGTYAGRPIRREIRREIVRQRSMGMTQLPKNISDKYMKIKVAERYLGHELKRYPKDEEILEYLESQARLRQIDCTIAQRHIQAYRMMDSGRVALASLFHKQDRYYQLERLVQNERDSKVRAIVYDGVLDKRERKVIIWRFGFEDEELTLKEVGNRLGLTKERVRQVEAEALRKIEKAMKRRRITSD